MKSVKNNERTIIIKNSRFICFLFHVEKKEEILKILEEMREKYYDATHCCFAYILDNEKKESDDGEPSGTAGIPMLQVLEKNGLNHVLCIVIRYFGKIKLGAGGLIRAYTRCVTETLRDHMITLKKGFCVSISFSYEKLKLIDHFLKDNLIIQKEFCETITYQINISAEDLEKLKGIPDIKIKVLTSLYLHD